jgi:hypothetical protein
VSGWDRALLAVGVTVIAAGVAAAAILTVVLVGVVQAMIP